VLAWVGSRESDRVAGGADGDPAFGDIVPCYCSSFASGDKQSWLSTGASHSAKPQDFG
jgi:hypothetical protein